MPSVIDFFPLDSDEIWSSSRSHNNIYDLNKILEIMYFRDTSLTKEASRQLEYFLNIMMWTFIIDTPKLFKVKLGKEEYVQMLRKFCIDRHVEFSKQFFNNQLFIGHDVKLLDDQQLATKKADDSYDGEKRVKLSGKFSLHDYFDQLTEKYLPNELKIFAAKETQKNLTSLKSGENMKLFGINEKKMQDFVLKYFDYSPSILREDEQDVNLYFKGIGSILDYLAAEILELSGNQAVDINSPCISSGIMHAAIAADEELRMTVFCHIDMIPLVDMTLFYGYNQELPSICINQKIDTIAFSNIPSEVHSVILEHFDSQEILLQMRLVCKQWNHFIMNNNLIWKNLTHNSIIAENIFKYCDSTFTLQELDQILERGKYVKPLHINQQVINYFYDQNDWKSLYFLLVGKHLKFMRDLEDMHEEDRFAKYFQKLFRGNNGYSSYKDLFCNSKKNLLLGIAGTRDMHKKFTKFNQEQVEKTVMIPKDQFEVFSKIGENMFLVALLDFSQYSSFISCRKFPKRGLLYCFYNREENRQIFHYFDQLDLNSETLIPFKLSDKTFKLPTPYSPHIVKQEQLVVNMDAPCEIFYLQNPASKRSFSSLVPCFEFSFNDERDHINLDIYKDDKIVLFSNTFTDFDEANITLSISIALADLEKRNFSQSHIISYETGLEIL
ncbi:hypothetical protein NAEGRDRAFT_69753 [Naegleria gruberi]|uniref:F-box domain-containing protein n=1 Tax=Naegleria gruberi TaxID=5762 RepID=D2VLE7_NAEGR|nr:uncharacterized protein NAEGRDRAFT_69753 [Naegleria gruberi]EFC42374.1 hypothetical protein NAEGRDRAFT_69753 [Naegleria gruberi]|eukprot:XP_002675118.1 hypothetical protein NAEGRDRAFT_69753 [Naegleria gruberi strain NEG-M]